MRSLCGRVSAFYILTSCKKPSHRTPRGNKSFHGQYGGHTLWPGRDQPCCCFPRQFLKERYQPTRAHSRGCLWGMCQIRFLCNFQTQNKWTSRAKCFLRLGSNFCAYTRECSQTTHTLAGSGRASPAYISLFVIMHCVLCLDVKEGSRGENTGPLGGWWQSRCDGLHSSSVLLFSSRIKRGSSHHLFHSSA